jgi:hypothetical protein
MDLRFLLDEDTTAELAHHLSKSGHDVARVVEVESLGSGSTDRAVMEHARSVDRIIVTHDDDYADPGLSERHRGVFYRKGSESATGHRPVGESRPLNRLPNGEHNVYANEYANIACNGYERAAPSRGPD